MGVKVKANEVSIVVELLIDHIRNEYLQCKVKNKREFRLLNKLLDALFKKPYSLNHTDVSITEKEAKMLCELIESDDVINNFLVMVKDGNIKYKSIEFIWELFGLSSDVLPEKRIHGLFDTLAENRMSIAHGRKTPQEVGRNYTKNELDVFYTLFKSYLSYVISSFETYVNNQEYLL